MASAEAKPPTCDDPPGPCDCFENKSSKGVIGYAEDRTSIVCINRRTMGVTYFDLPVTAASGIYTAEPVAH